MRILIVEDEALIAMMLADSLEDGGHEVMGPAATMAEALALCEAAAPPELAVLDINLRDGSNGVDVARALLERWGVLSIFASGQMMEARRARNVALGYIRKPYEAKTVLRSVEVAREVMSGSDARNRARGLRAVLRGRVARFPGQTSLERPCRVERGDLDQDTTRPAPRLTRSRRAARQAT